MAKSEQNHVVRNGMGYKMIHRTLGVSRDVQLWLLVDCASDHLKKHGLGSHLSSKRRTRANRKQITDEPNSVSYPSNPV